MQFYKIRLKKFQEIFENIVSGSGGLYCTTFYGRNVINYSGCNRHSLPPSSNGAYQCTIYSRNEFRKELITTVKSFKVLASGGKGNIEKNICLI